MSQQFISTVSYWIITFLLMIFYACSNPQNYSPAPTSGEFEVVDEHVDSTINKLGYKSEAMMKDFDSLMRVNKNARPYFDKAMATTIRTREMEKLIQDIKLELIENKENKTPSLILVGNNSKRPDGRASELKKKINWYIEDLHSWLPADTIDFVKFDINTKDNNGIPWETKLFYQNPLSADLVILSKTFSDIKDIEYTLIRIYYNRALKSK